MDFRFKLFASLSCFVLLSSCTQTLETDLEMAEVRVTGSTIGTANMKANQLESEFLNWDSLDFEFAFREPADQWSGGRYVFICKNNSPEDTLKFDLDIAPYKVTSGHWLWTSIEGNVNKYPGINYEFSSQGRIKAFYRQLDDVSGELLFNDFMYTRIRTPDPNVFKRWIRGRFVIPR